MEMQLITVPAENEYLICHTAQVRQHADQYFRYINLHLWHKWNWKSQGIRLRADRDDRNYLRHIEGDQADDYAIREKLEKDHRTEDILNFFRKTVNQCN
jgi:hypothetical protein